jgi:hypothetical protein
VQPFCCEYNACRIHFAVEGHHGFDHSLGRGRAGFGSGIGFEEEDEAHFDGLG